MLLSEQVCRMMEHLDKMVVIPTRPSRSIGWGKRLAKGLLRVTGRGDTSHEGAE